MVRRFGLSLGHYQRIERGKVDVRLSTLIKLSEAFGVPIGEFFAR